MLTNEPKLFSPEHVQLIGLVLIPLGSGIAYLIWQVSRQSLKIDLMWSWFTNDAHDITGYKPGDEYKKK